MKTKFKCNILGNTCYLTRQQSADRRKKRAVTKSAKCRQMTLNGAPGAMFNASRIVGADGIGLSARQRRARK